jgi:hypothetical protein
MSSKGTTLQKGRKLLVFHRENFKSPVFSPLWRGFQPKENKKQKQKIAKKKKSYDRVQLTNADEQSVQIQGPRYCEFEPKGQMLIEMKIQQEAQKSRHGESLKNTVGSI